MSAHTMKRALYAVVFPCVMILLSCTSNSGRRSSGTEGNSSESAAAKSTTQSGAKDDLQEAMDKLDSSIEKPSSTFNVSFKKSDSDGFTYLCEADVSPSGITGQQTDISPATHIGSENFPASNRSRKLDGTPYGSPAWQTVRGSIAMAYLNGHIRDAQEGVKYAGDEQTGGFDTRRYNFDLTGIDATIKRAMTMGNALGMRHTTDYNVKGSAWIAKDDGRMVKFQFDNIMTFSNGEVSTTHYEGTVTKK